MLSPMHISHMKRTSVTSNSVSGILCLMFVQAFIEGRAVLELAGMGQEDLCDSSTSISSPGTSVTPDVERHPKPDRR